MFYAKMYLLILYVRTLEKIYVHINICTYVSPSWERNAGSVMMVRSNHLVSDQVWGTDHHHGTIVISPLGDTYIYENVRISFLRYVRTIWEDMFKHRTFNCIIMYIESSHCIYLLCFYIEIKYFLFIFCY